MRTALVADHDRMLIGENEIGRYLDDHLPVPPEAEAHRLKTSESPSRYPRE